MMCSIEELGSNREIYPDAPEYGIYILGEDAEVGADAVHYSVWTMPYLNMRLQTTV